MKTTGPPVRLGFALRELEKIQRPLDVDLVRGDGCELGARRQQGRKMKDELDLELGKDALEDALVENGPGDLAIDFRRDRWFEAGDVERDDGAIRLTGEAFDETMADLAARAGDQHDGFAHARIILETSCLPGSSW